MSTIADGFKLSNQVFIPCMGLGTRQLQPTPEMQALLTEAVRAGYRRFDTASAYGNERILGSVLSRCGIDRSEFFISSKLWVTDRSRQAVISAFEKTLENLGLEYLDLYLIHWPETHGDAVSWQSINAGTWRVLEELYKSGRVRAIGVCNFLTHHLVPLLARASVPPMVNQLEFHPGYWQKSTVDFCIKHDIHVTAWDPTGRRDVMPDPKLETIAKRHGVTPAQVALRWCLQHGVSVLPRTMNPADLPVFADVFNLRLNVREMTEIDSLPLSCFSGLDPDRVSF